jgi:hypothetical protein
MASEQNLSPRQFVVGAATDQPTEPLRDELAEVGEVSAVGSRGLLLVTLGQGAVDVTGGWQALNDRLGPSYWTAPVIETSTGDPQIPTGEVSVRFEDDPSQAQLSRFASEHGLEVQRRSEFVPEQVVFKPQDPAATFLPDLVDTLGTRSDVLNAWANTLSRYRRVA